MIKVIIADDHPTMREGIKRALEPDPDIRVVAEANDGLELFALLARERPPDILLLDISMDHLEIDEAIPELHRQHPQMKIVIITAHDDERTVQDMLDLGVDGYLVKGEKMPAYAHALHEVDQGRPFFSQHIMEFVVKNQTPIPELSDREKEALLLLAQDLTADEIAEKMVITVNSVNTYFKRAKAKLSVKTRTAAAVKAISLGLISLSDIP